MSQSEKHVPEEIKVAAAAPITTEVLNKAIEQFEIATSLLLQPYEGYGGVRGGERAYYAHFLMRMRVEWGNRIPTAGVSITDKVNLYINPHFFTSLTCSQQQELLVHEVEHIVYFHPLRAKEVCKTRNEHQLMNIAMDANINVPLKKLTENLGVTIERLNNQLAEMGSKFRIDEKDHAEVHYEKLKSIQQEMKEKGFCTPDGMGEDGEIDDHGTWEESTENEELAKAVVKDVSNKAAEQTGTGNVPAHIARALEEMNRATVNWKRELQQFAVRSIKFARERTRTRRNRRTGILFSGSRKEPKVKLAVCVDSSGSVSDAVFTQFFAEINQICTMGVEVIVIDADCAVAAVYEYKKGKPFKRYGQGGTQYIPAITKAKELKVDGIIYCGDFDSSDTPSDPRIPFLWVGIENGQNPPGKFGRVVRITEDKKGR